MTVNLPGQGSPAQAPPTQDVGAYARVGAAVVTGLPTPYQVDVRVGRHRLGVDEPVSKGGTDSGPNPFGLLLAAVGSCTAITLRMYAERKAWPLEDVRVHMAYEKTPDGAGRLTRRIDLVGPLDEAQRARLLDIAERSPVTRAVRDGIPIIRESEAHAHADSADVLTRKASS